MLYTDTEFGFEWGAAKITRLFSNNEKGWVTLGIKTSKEDLQVYVTKTGKIRVHGRDGREWLPVVKAEGGEL